MDAKNYWQMFVETGAPELYLMYSEALKMEEKNVPECAGAGIESDGLQG